MSDERRKPEILPKPDELLALHDVTAELFGRLRDWFGVPDSVALNLASVDSAVEELSDPLMVAALAMRKLQALHLLSTPGVRTTTDVVITIVQDLDRALVSAPISRLRMKVETTDWDEAFNEILDGDPEEHDDESVPTEANEADPEVERFRMLHGQLHKAARAVLEASERRIRIFE